MTTDTSLKRPSTSSRNEWLYPFILAAILIFVMICRLRLLGVPFERDEGEYAYAGQEILKGIPPFQSVHHVKMPGVYGMNALFISLFGHSVRAIHLGLLFCNLVNISFCYVIARRLFNSLGAIFAAFVFAILTLSPATFGFTANAEHFVLLFALPALLLLLKATDDLPPPGKKVYITLFFSGLLWGMAYTMKQHAIYYIMFASVFYIYSAYRSKMILTVRFYTLGLAFAAGVLLPLLVLCIVFYRLHLFNTFWWWTFYYPRSYVSQITFALGFDSFKWTSMTLWNDNWPVLLLSATGLLLTILKRKSDHRFFLLVFFFISAFMVAAGNYFYQHYYLNAVPVLSFLAAAAVYQFGLLFQKARWVFVQRSGVILILPVLALAIILVNKNYYFVDNGDTISRNEYGLNIFPESEAIGKYLHDHTRPTDKIAIFGSEPQIYFYADRSAATGYIYTYEMTKDHQFAPMFQKQMAAEVGEARPAYIVMVNMQISWFATPISRLDNEIFDWANKYVADHYEPVGLVEVLYPRPSTIVFDSPNGSYTALTDSYVVIFKRKT